MSPRATLPLNGPHGNFLPGDDLRGVPDDIVAVWIADGAAAADTSAAPPAEQATASAPENAAGGPAVSGLEAFRQLRARAVELGIAPKGKNKSALEEAVAAAEG